MFRSVETGKCDYSVSIYVHCTKINKYVFALPLMDRGCPQGTSASVHSQLGVSGWPTWADHLGMQAAMPQLPAEFRRQYRELGLPAADVLVLADELPTAQYFDAVLAAGTPAKPAANWIMGDIMAFCKARLPFCLLQ